MLEITSVVENPTIQYDINTLIVYVRISPRNRIKKKNVFSQKSNFKTNRKKEQIKNFTPHLLTVVCELLLQPY